MNPQLSKYGQEYIWTRRHLAMFEKMPDGDVALKTGINKPSAAEMAASTRPP